MAIPGDFKRRVEDAMRLEVDAFFRTVHYASHLAEGEEALDEAYYIRHRVETVRRIRMTSRTDALALAAMIGEDYDAARAWARYTAQELNHDLLYLQDLRRHGFTGEQVIATPPLPATVALLDYLERGIARVGSLAAVAYSLFVEWNSAQYSAKVVAKAEAQFSPSHVKGSKAHLTIDEDQDHYAMMLDVAWRLTARQGDERPLFGLIHDIAGLLSEYFRELHAQTVGQQADRSWRACDEAVAS
ncbi:iron-containing redox enzyme family protein [Sorangium atrum]|uniref:Iron-containing redox enzyme family protein n=1 Tax=Sorangium atrum TaxID=2995308 RepID=A0ABT5C5L3_9BACT|nr:iron-containing redox enzyme family protein [Sorangium aterium]MDC0681706.1 iron-containing redox enzyme family protein [Sorangium aterium]